MESDSECPYRILKLEELKAELEGAYGVRVYILPFDVRDRKLAAASLESLSRRMEGD